jgi:hypothetical protein
VIEVQNLDKFDASVQRWFRSVEAAVTESATGMAKTALRSILNNSPQYTGDFVANWKVSVNSIDSSFTTNAIGGQDTTTPYQIGDSKAIRYAINKAKWPKLKLGDAIFLSNSAHHDDIGGYAWKIEEGSIKFRPMHVDAHHVVTRALYSVAIMNNPLTRGRIDALRKVGV